MSKQWYQALYAWTHPTFQMQMRQDETCASMTLDIRLVDYDGEGKQSTLCATRYVKLCDTWNNVQIYPLCLENGEAYLRLEDLIAADYVVMQCDERGNRLSHDPFTITYEYNGTMVQGDEVRMDETMSNQRIDITNTANAPLTLHIVKKVVDEWGKEICPDANLCFTMHIQGCGMQECVTLNAENDFHAVLKQLQPGVYEIREEEQHGFQASFVLDEQAVEHGQVRLMQGEHTLCVTNQKVSGNVLTLDQYIRCYDNKLIKPQDDACFTVRITSECFDEHYILNQENDFSLRLCNLPGGCYDIVAQNCGCQMRYLVNANTESDEAHIELCEDTRASVVMICEEALNLQQGPLRICKYVRRSDQTLVKPDPQESFKVMLNGCGVCEIFNLNAYNNFCVDIDHICNGEYEIRELDHEGYVASYIVNDEAESSDACIWIRQGECNCVSIINEERNRGEITISKLIRQGDGMLVKPERTARFLVTLRSVFACETYVLDHENDFCMHIHHLKEGSYEIKERRVDGFETTYTIDGGKEMSKARFVVRNGVCIDIKIINSVKKAVCGDLRIAKFIANAYGDYVKPAHDEEFVVHVEGVNLDACYTLRSSNRWSILLEGLKKGVYRIREEKDHHYETQYFVNGNEMSDSALVCMDQQNQDVVIVNKRRNYGHLKLNVMIQDCEGQLRKPSNTQFFDVIVETSEGSQSVCLDANNRFGVLLEDLPQGKVRIMQKDNYGYRVLYEVNHQRSNHGECIMNGEHEHVTIINQMMHCAGVVRIRKRIKTLHGHMIDPCEEDCYHATLRSRCVNQRFTLHDQNHFRVMFDDLEEGDYTLVEEITEGMECSYRINGKTCENGHFRLGSDDVDIEIINTVLPLPKLYVSKRIRKHGQLIKPQAHESFRFQLIGRGMQETYCLNQENDWCMVIDGLNPQHYEIKELQTQGCVMYQINEQIQPQGTLLFKHQDMECTIINEAESDAIVRITKRMRDENGMLCKPCGDESFEAVLESDCYKQCFTLDARNDWCVEIEGLPQGKYRVSQLGEVPYEVWINGRIQEDAQLCLSDQDVSVSLISSYGCENALIIRAYQWCDDERSMPDETCRYPITITHEGVCDHFVLSAENQFAISLEDICLGDYCIRSDQDVLFESCGQQFRGGIDVEMGCGTLCVHVLDETSSKQNIIIRKPMSRGHDDCDSACERESQVLLCSNREACYTLNRENDWMVTVCDVANGDYEVIDMSGDDVCYQIDDQAPQANGKFHVHNQSVTVTIIPNDQEGSCIDQTPPCHPGDNADAGMLSVHAIIQNENGELENAPQNARFAIRIDGNQVVEDFTLQERNGFLRNLTHLPQGTYHISAEEAPHYRLVGYRINDVSQTKGCVKLKTDDIHVDIIFANDSTQGSIHVMKYLRDESCDCLKRPYADETYEIVLQGEQESQRAVLNRDNRWSHLFENLADGDYHLRESGNSDATWIINGGREQNEANISLSGNSVNVKVINPAQGNGGGSLEICKYCVAENGEHITPSDHESCWVNVKGEHDTHRILLHPANHFYALLPHLQNGVYDVTQDNDESIQYVVDGQEVKQARVIIRDDAHQVDLLEDACAKTALTLSKLMQDENGTLSPAQSGTYRIHVSGCGFNEVVTLNEQNRYCTTLKHLPQGFYVVDELDGEDVSYIVDQGTQVDRAIVNVRKTHEVAIINPKQSDQRGSIHFTKYIRNSAGLLERPKADETFTFHISKENYQERVILNQNNQWQAQLSDLQDGNYVIQETDGQNVSYIINDQSECDFGIVSVKGNANFVSIINQEANTTSGSMTITKYVRGADGDLRKPSGAYRADVHISAPGYQNQVTLDAANHWQVTLSQLANGDYVLDEVGQSDTVTWRIDGNYEVDRAIVHINQDAHQVDMINPADDNTNVVHIQKFVRGENGALRAPAQDEEFRFTLQGTKTSTLVLNAENAWTMHLEGLENGYYTLKEQSDDYAVSYVINDRPHPSGVPFLLNGNRVDIHIINTPKQTNSYVLDVFKYIKKDNGGLMRPADGDEFDVEIIGNQYHKQVRLDESNQFHVRLRDLKQDTYTIREIGDDEYITTYRINGEERKEAIIHVNNQRSDVVEVINALTINQSVVELFKYVSDENGQIQSPAPNESFSVLLSGNNVHQIYTLNEQNNWHVLINTLSPGEYEVMEQGSGNDQVEYRINGGPLTSQGVFTISGGSENMVEIINRRFTQANGVIQLEKKIRDEHGDLITPVSGESFLIRIFHERYDEIFALDVDNGYFLTVDGLADGVYQLEEINTSGYGVTYVVDGHTESSNASVAIREGSVHQVAIINTQTELFYRVNHDDSLRIVIE